MSDATGFDAPVEVFAGGLQTDSAGNAREWTAAELDQIVANHQPAPIVVGHPSTDAPAFGWTESLRRDGLKLYAKFRNVYPAFADAVKNQLYPNRSVRLVQSGKGWQLAHVGFLGAAAPAIAGLEQIKFHAPQGEFHDYQREEEAAMADESKTTPPNPPEKPEGAASTQFTQADFQRALQDELGKMKAAIEAEFRKDNTRLAAELETERGIRQQAEFTAWLEQQSTVESGGQRFARLTPAQREGMTEFMAAIARVGEFEFAAGKDKAKKSPLKFFLDFVASLPGQVRLGQAPAGEDAIGDDPAKVAQKARQYMQEQAKLGVTVSVAQAVEHVQAGG